LKNKYNLTQLPFTGLSTLSNTGKELTLYDKNLNEIENFFYEPEWNNKLKGVSIERINPTVLAIYSNFGPSVSTSTPQKENSLFVQILPPKASLSVSPNPFSPYKSEHTIIQYKLPNPINKITVKIFDLKGREVAKIIQNTLASSNGSIIWDGKDKNNKILPIGIYIIRFLGIGTSDNEVYKKLKTVVIKK
jgi:flagellar hook assembly protein FlgD